MALTFTYKTSANGEDIVKTYDTYQAMKNDTYNYRFTVYSASLSGSANDPNNVASLFANMGIEDTSVTPYISNSDTLDVTNWDISNLTSLQNVFYATRFKHLVGLVVSSNIKYMTSAFNCMYYLEELDTTGWDTSNVTTFTSTFANCRQLTSIDLTNINTSKCQDFSNMFDGSYSLTSLNGIGNFDTSKVINMDSMFEGCKSLTSIDIANWNTSAAVDCNKMFYEAGITSIDLSGWNFSTVRDMSYMFMKSKLQSFSLNNKTFNSLTNVSFMFMSCEDLTTVGLTNLTGYDPKSQYSLNVDFSYMFAANDGYRPGDSGLVSLDLSGTSGFLVSTAIYMFYYCEDLTTITGLLNLDFSNCSALNSMFDHCSSLTSIDLSKYVINDIYAPYMFSYCSSLETVNISSFEFNNRNHGIGQSTQYMFRGCTNLRTIYCNANIDPEIYSSNNMFLGCTSLQGDIAYDPTIIDATGAKYIGGYFTPTLDIAYTLTDGTSGKYTASTFADLKQSITQNASYKTLLKSVRLCGIASDNSAAELFKGCTNLTDIYLNNLNIENIINTSSMFENCTNLKNIYVINYLDWSQSNIASSSNMFTGCTSIRGDIQYTSSITDIEGAKPESYFRYGCIIVEYGPSLTETTEKTYHYTYSDLKDTYFKRYDSGTWKNRLSLYGGAEDVGNFSTCTVKDSYNRNYTYLDFTNFYIPETVTSMAKFFADFPQLNQLILPKYSTANITDMSELFNNDGALQNISGLENLDTSSVTTFSKMFMTCYASELDLSNIANWDTSNVTNMSYMFYNNNPSLGRYKKDLDLSHWDVSKVSNMDYMFRYFAAKSVYSGYEYSENTLNISGWDLSGLTSCTSMFENSGFKYIDAHDAKLCGPFRFYAPAITTLNLRNSDTSDLSPTNTGMFYNCSKLKTLDISSWDLSNHKSFYGWFQGCSSLEYIRFNENGIGNSAVNLEDMFNGCSSLKYVDCAIFDTSNVVSFYRMFKGCTSMEYINLSNFDFSSLAFTSNKPLGEMFKDCTNLKHIWCSADLSSLTASWSTDMFSGCTSLSGIDGIEYDSSKLTAAYANTAGYFTSPRIIMKYNHFEDPDTELVATCTTFDDLSNITHSDEFCPTYIIAYGALPSTEIGFYVYRLFGREFSSPYDKTEYIDISYLDVCYFEAFAHMFSIRTHVETIYLPYSTSYNATAMRSMFDRCQSLKEIKNIERLYTDNVTTMESMFENCYKLHSLDISNFNTISCESLRYMFKFCYNLVQLAAIGFNVTNVTDITGVFRGCLSLSVIICDNDWHEQNPDLSDSADPIFTQDNNLRGAIRYDSSKKTISYANPTTGYFTPTGIHIKYVLHDNPSETVEEVFDTMHDAYYKFLNIPRTYGTFDSISIFGADLDYSTVWARYGDTPQLFKYAYSRNDYTDIQHQTFDVYRLYTSNWISPYQAFYMCDKLEYVNLSGWDFSNMETLGNLFYQCEKLKHFDTYHDGASTSGMDNITHMENVKDINQAFWFCYALLGIPKMYLPNLTSINYGFISCDSLTNLNIGCWEAHNIVNIAGAFSGCSKLTQLSFVDADDHNKYCAFENSMYFKGDYAFANSGITKIICNSELTMTNTESRYVFDRCNSKLRGAIPYDSSKITAIYASPYVGYFTSTEVVAVYSISDGAEQHSLYSDISTLKSELTQNDSYKTSITSCKLIYDLDAAGITSWISYDNIFNGCTALKTVDIKYLGLNTYVQSIFKMFNGCSALTTITCDYNYLRKGNIDPNESVFDGCTSLVGKIPYDSSKVKADMASPKYYFTGKALSFYINNIECSELYVNGVECDSLIINGVEV